MTVSVVQWLFMVSEGIYEVVSSTFSDPNALLGFVGNKSNKSKSAPMLLEH